MRALSIALALSLGLASPAFAQEEALERMLAAQAAAEAAASRPGDEALSCEQLEAELGATMNDPAVQTQIAEMGEWAQGRQEQMNAARGQAMGMTAMGMFGAIAGSFLPGAGYAQMAMQRAQAAGMQARASSNMAEMAVQAQRIESIMPQMMRGQRIVELGQAKQCTFVQQEAPPAE